MTLASVIEQINIPCVPKSTYCSTLSDINELIYFGKNTKPLSLLKGSQFSNLLVFLPLWNPNTSNTLNGASTDKQLTFKIPV